MRLYSLLLLFFISQISFSVLLAQKTIRFAVSDIPEDSSPYIAIRGSVNPLSWEQSLFLKKVDENKYAIELEFEESVLELEYKFVLDKKGKVSWEGIQNRFEYLKGNRFDFESEWNLDKWIDPATLPLLSVEELQEDFEVVKTAIQQVHPGLYRYNDSAEVQQHLAQLKSELMVPRTYAEAFLSFGKFAASIQCDHTFASLWNQEAIINALIHRQADKFPFTFQWIEGRMIVLYNASEAEQLKQGTEILTIDGIPVKEILARMLPYIPADGATLHNKIRKAEVEGFIFRYNAFDALYPLLFPIKAKRLQLSIQELGNAHSSEVSVSTLKREERAEILLNRYPDFPDSPEKLWSYRIIEGEIGYLQIGSFDTDNFKNNWRQTLKEAFRTFEKAKVKNLVLDIRENQGGLDDAGGELLKYMMRKPCTSEAFEGRTRFLNFPEEVKPHIKTWDYWFYDLSTSRYNKKGRYYAFPEEYSDEVYKSTSKSFKGNMFLLCSAKNVSGAFYLTRTFRTCEVGKIVGQETGGNQNGLNGGSILFLKPPNSRINIDMPIMGMFSDKKMPNKGIEPDIKVKKTVEAVVNGVDIELETVIKHIQKQK